MGKAGVETGRSESCKIQPGACAVAKRVTLEVLGVASVTVAGLRSLALTGG